MPTRSHFGECHDVRVHVDNFGETHEGRILDLRIVPTQKLPTVIIEIVGYMQNWAFAGRDPFRRHHGAIARLVKLPG